MKAYSCRYQTLAELVAVNAGTPPIYDLPGCDEPAAYATRVELKREGQESETFTRQCRDHDREARRLDGYLGHIALRGVPLDPA